MVWFLIGQILSLPPVSQNWTWDHPGSHPVVSEIVSSGVKWPVCEADHSPLSHIMLRIHVALLSCIYSPLWNVAYAQWQLYHLFTCSHWLCSQTYSFSVLSLQKDHASQPDSMKWAYLKLTGLWMLCDVSRRHLTRCLHVWNKKQWVMESSIEDEWQHHHRFVLPKFVYQIA